MINDPYQNHFLLQLNGSDRINVGAEFDYIERERGMRGNDFGQHTKSHYDWIGESYPAKWLGPHNS